MAKIFGFGSDDGNILDAIKDMTDGGGAGQPGSSFSTEGGVLDSDDSNDYVETDKDYDPGDKQNAISKIINTATKSSAEDGAADASSITGKPATKQDKIDEYLANNPDTWYDGTSGEIKKMKEGTGSGEGEKIDPNDKDAVAANAANRTDEVVISTSDSQFDADSAVDLSSNDGESSDKSLDDGVEDEVVEEDNPFSAENILEMAKAAGMVESDADIAALIKNPQQWLKDRNMTMQDLITKIDPDAVGTNLDGSDPDYKLNDLNTDTFTTTGDADQASDIDDLEASTYDASTSSDLLGTDATTVDGQTTEVSADMLVDLDDLEIDVAAAERGEGALGSALDDYASIDISTMIDTTTVEGKLLANKLTKEGKSFVDSKTSLLWQMKTISAEFTGPDGQPKIPRWAEGLVGGAADALGIGVTNTAGMAALANATMNAVLGVAEKESTFYQTLTVENLNNKQQAIINKASVLANMEIANLDARQNALVSNAKAFLEVDLANLTNAQQAEVINTQEMVQALFNDQSAINAERLFTATSENEMKTFWSELQSTVDRFNTEQINVLKKFNTGEMNDAAQFVLDIENERQQFYANMQFSIDTANAKWRQSVETGNKKIMYDAAAADVKSMLDISQEGQNQMWDRVDSMFDAIFKGADNEAQREYGILVAQISAAGGGKSGGNWFTNALGAWAGAGFPLPSDMRLKNNLTYAGSINKINLYKWEWNETAKSLGYDKYPTTGVLAQEIRPRYPDAVAFGKDGYLTVNYRKL